MKTPVYVNLWYSSTWNDITTDVLCTEEHEITIQGGQQNWLSRVSPTKCDLSLINTIIHPGDSPTKIGKYSPRNAGSPLYGLIGRNTPLRVYIRWLMDDFSRTSASGWGTSVSNLDSDRRETAIVGSIAWTTTGSGTGASAVGSGVATHTQTTNNGFRLTLLASGANIRDAEVRAVVTADEANIDGGAIQPGNLVLRALDTSNYYYARVQVTTAEVVQVGIRKIVAGVDSEVVAPVTVTGLTYSGQQLAVAFLADGPHLAAKVWAAASGEPFAWQVTATDTSLPAAGAPGVRSGVAASNTDVPVIFTYDNLEVRSYRFTGEVEAFPQEWTLDATDDGGGVVWAPLTAYGLMYRLGLPGQDVLARSAPYRYITEFAGATPAAYWPMNTPAEVAVGGADMEILDGQAGWEPGQLENWLEDGLVLDASFGVVRGEATISASDGATDLLIKGQPGNTGDTFQYNQVRLDAISPGVNFVASVFADWNAGSPTLSLVTNAGVLDTDSADAAAAMWDNRTHHWRILLDQSGANINISVYLDTVVVLSATHNSVTMTTSVRMECGGSRSTLGQAAVWSGTPPSVSDVFVAMFGHTGETADQRVARVCDEEGIEAFVHPTPGDEPLGPQPIAPPLEMFIGSGECTDVDGGVFAEPRHTLGFSFRATPSLVDEDPTLTLDYAAFEVGPPMLHREDLDHCKNDITVTRRGGGSSARLVKESGHLNASEPHTNAKAVGHYPVRPELSLESDIQPTYIAARLLRHGTTDELRFSTLGVDMTDLYRQGKAALIGDVLAVDPGDKIAVEDLPAWLGGGDTAQIQRGFTETLGPFHWMLENVTSPARPFDAAGLFLDDGSTNDYASTPDTAVLDITGDLWGAVELTDTLWENSSEDALMGKWTDTGNQRSWSFYIDDTNALALTWSTNGSAMVTEIAGFSINDIVGDNERAAFAFYLDVNNGAGGYDVFFYWAPCIDGPWLLVDEQDNGAGGTTSIFNSSAPLSVGLINAGSSLPHSHPLTIHAAQVRNGGPTGTIVANARFQEQPPGTTSFVDDAGRTWTVNGSAAIV